MKLVVDATVAAKWLLAEALSPKALDLVHPGKEPRYVIPLSLEWTPDEGS